MTVRPCGAYADHVDHIDPRLGRRDSALKPTGSTRRWRRIRRYVLDRDGWACQVLVDADPWTGEQRVVDSPRPTEPPAGPDDPAWLRATCPAHNLQRGPALTDARPTQDSRQSAGRWDW